MIKDACRQAVYLTNLTLFYIYKECMYRFAMDSSGEMWEICFSASCAIVPFFLQQWYFMQTHKRQNKHNENRRKYKFDFDII